MSSGLAGSIFVMLTSVQQVSSYSYSYSERSGMNEPRERDTDTFCKCFPSTASSVNNSGTKRKRMYMHECLHGALLEEAVEC